MLIKPVPTVEPTVTPKVETTSKSSTSSNGIKEDALKAAGIAAGVGLMAGAVALGVNEAEKKKIEKDANDYKYEYETSEDTSGQESLFTEVSGDEISAFNGGEY